MSKEAPSEPPRPKRSLSRKHSTLKSGRTIAERREHLETSRERAAARDKVKRHARRRVLFTIVGFAVAIAAIVVAGWFLFHPRELADFAPTLTNAPTPTIEVIDEDAGGVAAHLTSRMQEYVANAESDFRELGYTPTRAVIPSGAIREVDFYLDGYPGRFKLLIDRGAGVSVEDADRMLRYLASIDVTDFTYIDVRIDGKAYWK